MAQTEIKLLIPFEALVHSITHLDLEQKRQLWQFLEAEMVQAEEEQWEQDPAFQAELAEARAAYQAGDAVTLDEYLARNQDPA
jgi:hypothetical protein